MRTVPMNPLRMIPLLLLITIGSACGEEEPVTPPQQLPGGSPFHYPEDLWDAGVEGETVLRLFVDTLGAVDSAQVERGSGYEAFDSAAVAGGRDLRFEPAVRGDKTLGMWVLLPVRFDLPASAADSAAAREPQP
jgi:TonB family protein